MYIFHAKNPDKNLFLFLFYLMKTLLMNSLLVLITLLCAFALNVAPNALCKHKLPCKQNN